MNASNVLIFRYDVQWCVPNGLRVQRSDKGEESSNHGDLEYSCLPRSRCNALVSVLKHVTPFLQRINRGLVIRKNCAP